MDAHTPKPSYEYTISEKVAMEQTKTTAFEMMRQLEGWCTNLKASILIDLIYAIKPQTVVEVGVFGGKSFIPMAHALKQLGKGRAYGVDPWKHTASAVGMEGVNLDYWEKLDHEMILNGLLAKINEFGLNDYISIIRASSEEAPVINNIDLIHIDGNHSEKTSLYDVKKWVPMVRKDGIVIFDDVDWPSTAKAVAWLDRHCKRVALVQDANIYGIWIKK
jgi:predicted O-methyltransferase YrrM